MSSIDLPEWASDGVYVGTKFNFDWRDRLRILFRGEAEVDTRTLTEHKVGRTETDRVRVTVTPVFPPRREPVCYDASAGVPVVAPWPDRVPDAD